MRYGRRCLSPRHTHTARWSADAFAGDLSAIGLDAWARERRVSINHRPPSASRWRRCAWTPDRDSGGAKRIARNLSLGHA